MIADTNCLEDSLLKKYIMANEKIKQKEIRKKIIDS